MTGLQSTAVNQLRHAANNLYTDSFDYATTDESREVSLKARQLIAQLANALESGTSYKTAYRAEEFDKANEAREGQLHYN